jgi:acetylornithine deacetylase/succinyl-diaminopimelate desuccinylase-like protein
MASSQLLPYINDFWDRQILPTLQEYIRIPNESPLFDPAWKAHGHMERAVALVADWLQRQQAPDGKLQVLQDGDRTPLLLLEFPGSIADTVLIYGHLDKQPPMVGWRTVRVPDTVPRCRWPAVGGAGDDGYAVFAAWPQ